MKAMEMFNNYKLGKYNLKVKIAKPLNNSNKITVQRSNGSNADKSDEESEFRSVSARSVDSKSQPAKNGDASGDDEAYGKPAGRGQLQTAMRQRGSEVSRPYARRLMSRRNSVQSQQSLLSDLPTSRQQISGSEYQENARATSRHSSVTESRKSGEKLFF